MDRVAWNPEAPHHFSVLKKSDKICRSYQKNIFEDNCYVYC